MKISLPLSDVENTIKTFFSFYFNPKKCLNKNEKGHLSIEGINAYRFWFFTTLFQVLLLAIILLNKDEFSVYFFLIVLTYSILRMLLLGTIAFSVGYVLGIKDYKLSVDFIFLLTGIVSTIALILSIPLIDFLGFKYAFIHNSIPSKLLLNLPKYFIILEPIKILIIFISMFFYGVIVPERVFNIPRWLILVWLIGIQLVYHLVFREHIIFYLSKMVEMKLFG